MANLFELPRALWIDSAGNPLSGGKLYFYEAGTSTALDTYSDNALTSANANPVVANASGYWGAIYLKAQSYKVILKTSADVEVWSQDNVHGSPNVAGTTNILHVATIAAMTALAKSQLSANQQIVVGGYTAIADGGGGTFYWHSGSSTTADEGTVFAADEGGTGRWKRIFSGPINVRWFGATGDGVTNDTDAIQDAIDYCYTNNSGEVFIPAGTYSVTTLTKVFASSDKTVNIVGAGERATRFTKASGVDPIFQWSTSGASPREIHCEFRDFMIDGAAQAHDGIKLTDVARFKLRNVSIDSCDKAVHVLGGLIWEAEGGHWTTNNYGLYTRVSVAPVYSNLIKLDSVFIQGSLTFAADVGKASGVKIVNCNFDGGVGVIFRDTNDDEAGQTSCVVKDCWFEGTTSGWDIEVEDMTYSMVCLENNYHINPTAGQAIRVRGGRCVTVKQCISIGASDVVQIDAGTDFFVMESSIFQLITDNAANSLYLGATAGTTTVTRSINNYKSGTFSPTLVGTTAAGAGTYTTQAGSYVRNGNVVDFSLLLVWTAHTGTGNMEVSLNDIPYTAANATVSYPCVVVPGGVTYTGDLVARVVVNTKTVTLESAVSNTGLAAVAIDTTGTLYISGSYHISAA